MNQNNQQNNQNKETIINLDNLGKHKNYEVSVSIKTSKGIADHVRELIVVAVLLGVVILSVVYSVKTLSSPNASQQDKSNAQSLIAGIAGLAIGYITGSKNKGES